MKPAPDQGPQGLSAAGLYSRMEVDEQALAHPSEESDSLSPSLKPVLELPWMAEHCEFRATAPFSGSPSEAAVGGYQESGLYSQREGRKDGSGNRTSS